jgi:hypothetical protein
MPPIDLPPQHFIHPWFQLHLPHVITCYQAVPSTDSTEQPVGPIHKSFQVIRHLLYSKSSNNQPLLPGTVSFSFSISENATTMCTFDRPIDAMGHPLVSRWRRNSRGCPKGGTCPEESCRHQDILTKNPLQICEHCKRWADQYIDYTGGQGSRHHHSVTEIPASG